METATAVSTTLLGDKLEGASTFICSFVNSILYPSPVSKDMDTYVRRVPLGVCASIAPFNFPA